MQGKRRAPGPTEAEVCPLSHLLTEFFLAYRPLTPNSTLAIVQASGRTHTPHKAKRTGTRSKRSTKKLVFNCLSCYTLRPKLAGRGGKGLLCV
eukprot:6078999-Amphidinium_carterae.1